MCLNRVLGGKEKKATLAKLKDKIVVWKVLAKPIGKHDHYSTDCKFVPVFAGEVKFTQNIIDNSRVPYLGGGHFWLTKEGAENWGVYFTEKLVRCTIKKSDINSIGYQCVHLVVVVKKATFPKYIGKDKR